MPIVLDTQKALRPLQRLPFCYWCGRDLAGEADTNVDHVPPSTIFLKDDRSFPLILPTHVECNGERSVHDQLMGTLVGVFAQAPCGRWCQEAGSGPSTRLFIVSS
jgi:hypothetical protein